MKALLIIDMQNDFMPKGALGVKDADKIIPAINQLICAFENVFATKDWHPKNHISFASSHGKNVGDIILINQTHQKLWPDHCIQNTKGAEITPKINTKKIKKVFEKGSDVCSDSYSAFFDNDHKKSTGLDLYLKKENIDTIYMVGVATDYCVKFSAIDAADLGFQVYVIKDCCASIDKNQNEKLYIELEKKGIHIISHKEII